MIWRRTLLAAGLSLAAFGCATEESWAVPSANNVTFRDEVYPVLIRDCAFHTCHGSTERFFRLWGPGRVRLSPTAAAFDPRDDTEVRYSFQRALSMVNPAHPEQSLLLRKALAIEAGGAGHLGADKFGRNVYRSAQSPGYQALARWVYSVKAL